ncbi:MAG: NnrS family protein [Gallionella sp.]|nr:NnrS family protein [Gallionella sp.]
MLKDFTAAPHRVMFFGGALQAIAAMLWWTLELATRYGIVGQPLSWAFAPSAAHVFLMSYSLLPFFMFGFLMTTFPRWMAGKEIPPKLYVTAFGLMFLGAVLFYVGMIFSAAISVVAVASSLAGWAVALYALVRVLLDTRPSDKRHPIVLTIALALGWCGLASFMGWLLTDEYAFLSYSIHSGLWFFLLPLFASVAHRMIPFFTSNALSQHDVPRPFWPWWTMLAGSVVHGALSFAGMTNWLWLCDAPIAASALYLSYLWGFRRSLSNPLLAVLHVGFAWMGIAMLLFTAQSFVDFISEISILALAPLHALTIGCYATLMIGMGTRVTLGHSGLKFEIGTSLKLMFLGIQLVTLMRVMPDVVPLQNGYVWYVISALGWLACFSPWVWRYLPAFWSPRADGKPG